jgi:hypothetical protein
MLDDFVGRGFTAAQEAGRRTIYGPCPADRQLFAWLDAEEPVLIELDETLEQMKDVATYRRRMGAVFGKKTKAAHLEGFTAAGGGDGSHKAPQSSSKAGKTKAAEVDPAKGAAKTSGKGREANKANGGNEQVARKHIFVYEDGKYSIGTPHTRPPHHACPAAHRTGAPTRPPLGEKPGGARVKWTHETGTTRVRRTSTSPSRPVGRRRPGRWPRQCPTKIDAAAHGPAHPKPTRRHTALRIQNRRGGTRPCATALSGGHGHIQRANVAPRTALTGAYLVDWPGICKLLGMDPKLSGPAILGVGNDPNANCPWGHKKGGPMHRRPTINGKPFHLDDYKEQFNKLGLTKFCPELKEEVRLNKKPPGTPKKVGNTLVYPARHF